MATAVSFGQITITDLTDIGTLSVYPTANQPLSVIYNPNATNNQNFIPNWGDQGNSLVVTPVIYYGGTRLYAGVAGGPTVTWTRQEGSASPSALTTGETVTNGVLTVSANKFTSSSTMLSYIVSVSYTEPQSSAQLTAEGKITFTLVQQASATKRCSITGSNIFKYNEHSVIQPPQTITLEAHLEGGVSVSQWQYKDSSDNWAQYPNSTATTTLTVSHNDSTFNNDRCTIRLTTNYNDIYDIFTITKLRDGAPGDKVVTGVLSNDDQMIPCDEDGDPFPDASTAFTGASSTITIYEAGRDITSQWRITISCSTTGGVNDATFTTSQDGRTVTVTAMSKDVAHIYFRATHNNGDYDPIEKTFSLAKNRSIPGHSPVVHNLSLSTVAVNRSVSIVQEQEVVSFAPSTVTINAYETVGTETSAYSGRFRIYYLNGNGAAPVYESLQDESTYTISTATLSNATASGGLEVRLYAAGSFTTLLDHQSIVITKDGERGLPGEGGPGGVNLIFGEELVQISCTSANRSIGSTSISIPFYGVKGTEKVNCTVATPIPSIAGVSANQPTQATSANNYNGMISWTIPANTNITSPSGTISLSFTIGSGQNAVTVIRQFTWVRVSAAANAVLLQLFSNRGTVLSADLNEVTIQADLLEGALSVSSAVTAWQWAAYGDNDRYEDIDGEDDSSITIQRGDVDGFVSLRCTANYGGNPYTAYISVVDSTDPLHVVVMSSIGDQILNGSGAGAFYVLCYQGESEVDALKSNRFLTEAPSSASVDDFYYHINQTNKTVTLYRYNGSAWKTREQDAEDQRSKFDYSGSYTWTHTQADGTIATGMATTGKVIYVDGSKFSKKMISNVRVQI